MCVASANKLVGYLLVYPRFLRKAKMRKLGARFPGHTFEVLKGHTFEVDTHSP
jgi:hypothetical protein